jgi:hypothetical protein
MHTLSRRGRQMAGYVNMQRVFAATGDVPTIVTSDQGVYVHLSEGTVVHHEKVAPLIRVDLNLHGQVIGLFLSKANIVKGYLPDGLI